MATWCDEACGAVCGTDSDCYQSCSTAAIYNEPCETMCRTASVSAGGYDECVQICNNSGYGGCFLKKNSTVTMTMTPYQIHAATVIVTAAIALTVLIVFLSKKKKQSLF